MAQIIIVSIILLVVIAVIRDNDDNIPKTHGDPPLDEYRQQCQVSCMIYIDSNFSIPKAIEYCEKSLEIDINKNGKILGEAGKIDLFGVCEDKVYCFNRIECNWGASKKSRITLDKCKDIMCEFYTEQNNGNNETAASIIQQKMQFGSCDINDPEISFGTNGKLTQWWTDNFQNVHCPGKTG